MSFRHEFWRRAPQGKRISAGLCRRLARNFPGFFARYASDPIFVIGFNSGGKSTIVRTLQRSFNLCVYPDEGNLELWFPGFYPWIQSSAPVGPIWSNPEAFVAAVNQSRSDSFRTARAFLGAYQGLYGVSSILNDSGMLAALLPDIAPTFPDAKFIHFVRDGRVVSYLTARIEWSNIMRNPAKYGAHGVGTDFGWVLRKMSQYWAWTLDRVRLVTQENPDSVLEVRYEALCRDPDTFLLQIAAFLDCAGGPAEMPDFVNMNAVAMADMSSKDKQIIDEAIGDELAGLGYV